jgi:para-nitrobenzyl esterase
VFARGQQNDVPTLTGSNADENGAVPAPKTSRSEFEAQARTKYGARADEFLSLYDVASDADAARAQNASARDLARTATNRWAVSRSKTARTDVYTYFWNHVLPGPDAAAYGAFHTSEVPYALNSLSRSDRPFDESDRRIADLMSSYWANFAITGNPNGKGLPRWASVRERPESTLQIGDDTRAIPVAGSSVKQTFFERFLDSLSSGPATLTSGR